MKKFGCLKIQLALQVTLIKHTYDEFDRDHENKICYPWFISNMKIVYTKFELMSRLSTMIDEIISKFETFVSSGSGWIYKKTNIVHVKIIRIKKS